MTQKPTKKEEWKKVELQMPPLYGVQQFQENNTIEGLFLKVRSIRTRFGERKVIDLDVNGQPVSVVMTANLQRQIDYLLERNLLPVATPIRIVYRGRQGKVHMWDVYYISKK